MTDPGHVCSGDTDVMEPSDDARRIIVRTYCDWCGDVYSTTEYPVSAEERWRA